MCYVLWRLTVDDRQNRTNFPLYLCGVWLMKTKFPSHWGFLRTKSRTLSKVVRTFFDQIFCVLDRCRWWNVRLFSCDSKISRYTANVERIGLYRQNILCIVHTQALPPTMPQLFESLINVCAFVFEVWNRRRTLTGNYRKLSTHSRAIHGLLSDLNCTQFPSNRWVIHL